MILALTALLALADAPTKASPPPTPQALEAEARAIVQELVACGTRHSLSSRTDPARGIGCGRDKVVKRFEAIAAASGGKLRVVVDRFETSSPRTGNAPVPMENVYAILEGSDPDLKGRVFAVSGHYDSMPSDIMDPNTDAPGADDDASGVAAAVLAAKLLVHPTATYRATLLFAAVAGEEQGLLGARRLKEWIEKQGWDVGGYVTNDIVGSTNRATDKRLRVFSDGGPDGIDSPSRQMARFVEETAGKAKVRLVFRKDRLGRGGDHLPFVEAGLPAVRFTEPLENYRHQHQTPRFERGQDYGDEIQHLEFGFLAGVGAINAQVLGALALAPAAPRSVVLGGAVTPSATLTIDAPPDPERAGFLVLRRETTAPQWTPWRRVDGVGEQVLKDVSTDNDFFAVASVGRNGRLSLPVAAAPAVRRPPGSMPAPGTPPASASPSSPSSTVPGPAGTPALPPPRPDKPRIEKESGR